MMINNNQGIVDGNLGQALIALKENLDMMDQQSVHQVGNALATAIEALAPAQRVQYKDEIAQLISTLEARILGLEQQVRDAKDTIG